MTFVVWYAAVVYCRSVHGRLPTESEWEYAAHGGQTTEFPWGDEAPDSRRVNFGGSGRDAPVDVGMYPPNRFGLYDMAGSVWEYTADAWKDR